GTAGAGGPGDLPHRQTPGDPCGARAAQDPQRQDHAPAAPRRRRGPRTRGHLDAGRSERVRSHPGHQGWAELAAPSGRGDQGTAPIGTNPAPGRFLALMSASWVLNEMVTAGVCSGMNLTTHVGNTSLNAPWIMPTSRLFTVTGAPESPG